MDLFQIIAILLIVYMVWKKTKSYLWTIGSFIASVIAVPFVFDQAYVLLGVSGSNPQTTPATTSTCNCS